MEAPLPLVCPVCGGKRIARVIWGCVYLRSQDEKDANAGVAVLAGDYSARRLANRTIRWACLDCDSRWIKLHHLTLQCLSWQREKEQAIARGYFEEAKNFLTHQMALRPEIEILVKGLSCS